MEAEDSALTIDGNNSATIIFSGTSYSLPPKLELELTGKYELQPVTTGNLGTESEIIVDVPRGVQSCRVIYVPVKDCNGETQLVTTELQQAAAHLLQRQSDSLSDGVQNVTSSFFGVESELVQTQLGDGEEQLDASGIPINKEPIAKRKGGWPKGKKRKKEAEDSKAPKAPTTGYVLFLNERRQFYKETNPEIPFAEVTKILGNEWSNLGAEEKQKYLEEAEADKRRYREELKAYQQSEAYQAYLKRKKLKALCSTTSDGTCPDGEITEPNPLLDDIDDDESNELYCKVCDQFFNSLHNKKEHLYGRHHLQAITGEFQKDILENGRLGSEEESLNAGDLSSDLLISLPQGTSSLCHSMGLSSQGVRGPPNVTQAMQDFIDLTLLRETEIQELRASQERAKTWQLSLNKDILHLQEVESRMEADLKNLIAYGATLSTQLETLRMVPTLFGMINF